MNKSSKELDDVVSPLSLFLPKYIRNMAIQTIKQFIFSIRLECLCPTTMFQLWRNKKNGLEIAPKRTIQTKVFLPASLRASAFDPPSILRCPRCFHFGVIPRNRILTVWMLMKRTWPFGQWASINVFLTLISNYNELLHSSSLFGTVSLLPPGSSTVSYSTRGK